MSSGKNRLMLMMALTMPGAAHALGLGDIHVDSKLNERLAAEIDIVGASALDLTDLRAAVANGETFLRFGADRPAFLSSATFKVAQDSQGRPVLAVRSTESFTEPVVNFLVDLHWRKTELVRQYTLLLDPAGFDPTPSAPSVPTSPGAPTSPDVPASPAVATTVVETKTQTVARSVDPATEVEPPAEVEQPSDQPDSTSSVRTVRKTTHVKVGAKATLRGVAWRVGERSRADLDKMMIAIFRANPTAFEGNINRLHLGAILTIPSHAELAAISTVEARREVHAQMAAWHSPQRAAHSPAIVASPTPVEGAPPVASAPPVAAPDSLANAALDRRVHSLEQELSDVKGVLESKHGQLIAMQQQAELVETSLTPSAPPERTNREYAALAIVAGLGTLASLFTALYVKFRRRAATLNESRGDRQAMVASPPVADATVPNAAFTADDIAVAPVVGAQNRAPDETQESVREAMRDSARAVAAAVQVSETATQPLLPAIPPIASTQRSEIAPGAFTLANQHETTVSLRVGTVNQRMEPTRLDYNLLDLDQTVQHVQMPSALNEQPVMKERRTNLADVLKLAIDREPDRHDLRMKLLELYYSAAAANRQAFLEVVQNFSRDRDFLQSDQWDKIVYMGRQIALDSPLFAEEAPDADDLADCA